MKQNEEFYLGKVMFITPAFTSEFERNHPTNCALKMNKEIQDGRFE